MGDLLAQSTHILFVQLLQPLLLPLLGLVLEGSQAAREAGAAVLPAEAQVSFCALRRLKECLVIDWPHS